MKAVICLIGMCLLAGLVSADYGWELGKQYLYKVRGRVMTGISEIDNQYAGMQMEYEQLITPKQNGQVNVRGVISESTTKNLRILEVRNEKLEQGWRESQITREHELIVHNEFRQFITSPIDLTLKQGVVQSIQVQGNLPTWATNIKKSMATVWTLDTAGSQAFLEGNLNRLSKSTTLRQVSEESGFFFKTVEQTVHGECETYYTVSQNSAFDPPFQFQKDVQARSESRRSQSSSSISSSAESEEHGHHSKNADSTSTEYRMEDGSLEKPWSKAYKLLCDKNDQIYEVVKTVNFTACNQKPVLAYNSPSEIKFHPGDNDGGNLWQRALVSRYLTCGSSRRSFNIMKITQQERFYSGLQDVEKVVAGAQKNITLISIVSGSEVAKIKDFKIIDNLVYAFDPKEQNMFLNGKLRRPYAKQSSSESYENSQESQSESGELQQQRGQHRSLPESGEDVINDAAYLQGTRTRDADAKESKSENQETSNESYFDPAEGKKPLPMPSLDEAPLSSMLITRLDRNGLKKRAHKLLKMVVVDLTNSTEGKDSSIAKREPLSKIATLVKVLRVLNKEDIHSIAHEWVVQDQDKQQVGRSIFLDALAIAGTNPCVNYLLQQIKQGKINGEEAAQILSTLPLYIRTPTKDLLQEYFTLIESRFVLKQQQVRTTAVLSFSTLVYNACINKLVKNTRYPVALYGKFCHEEYAAIQFVPIFIEKLEKLIESEEQSQKNNHWTITLLAALGNIGHPDVIEVVQKILDKETNPLIRVKAIYALKHLVQSRSTLNQPQNVKTPIHPVDRQSRDLLTDAVIEKQVLPVLVSVAFDRGEYPEVRTAAISLLFQCTYADSAIWQQIAMSTWFEQSRQVRSYIVSALRSFAELDAPSRPISWVQQRKARSVLPLVKNIEASVLSSHNFYTTTFTEGLNTGFVQQFQFFGSEDSIIPNYLYYKNILEMGNGAATTSPIEVSLSVNTFQRLAMIFIRAGEWQEDLQKHPDWAKIYQRLNITARNQEAPATGSLYLNLQDEIERLWTFDERELFESVLGARTNIGNEKMNINYQKVVHLAEHMHSMPTIMGIPLVHSMRMQVLVSLRGTVKLELKDGALAVQADLAPVYAWNLHRKLSYKCPFTGKKYQTGVHSHFIVEAPFSAIARKAPGGQLELAITPSPIRKGALSGTTEIACYQQHPYTAIIHDEFWPTVYSKGGRMQIVHTNLDLDNKPEYKAFRTVQTYGKRAFGLVFRLHEQSEFPKEESSSGWVKFVHQFHSASCFFNSIWLGSPSLRFAERKIVLDLQHSETKTILLQMVLKSKRVSIERKILSSEENSSEGVKQKYLATVFSRNDFVSSSSSESENWFKLVGSTLANRTKRSFGFRELRQSHEKSQSDKFNERQSESQERHGSESASSESREADSTESFVNNQHSATVFSIAIVGKKSPLVPLNQVKGGINSQEALHKRSQNTIQYLVQFVHNPLGKVYLRFFAGNACRQAANSLESLLESWELQAIGEQFSNSYVGQQPSACVVFQGSIDTPKKASRDIVAIRRKTLLGIDNLKVKVEGKIQAGVSCNMMPMYVSIKGELRRDQEMTEWAQSKSPEAKKCIRDERKGFEISRICMDVSEQQAAALNEIKFTLHHSKMPTTIQKAANEFENMLKALLFPHMSENIFPERAPVQNNTVHLYGRMTPNKQFVSFHIRKPGAVLEFNNVKTNAFSKAILPLTATQTLYDNVKDRLLRSQSDSMCSIQNGNVNTFDNVTYSFQKKTVQGCQHVLVKDCSGLYPMSVLINNLHKKEGRLVTVLLGGQTKIQIIPRGEKIHSHHQENGTTEENILLGRSASGMTVLINGKQHSLPYIVASKSARKGWNRQPIAEIMEIPNGGVQLIGRRIKIATDGERVIVHADNTFRSRTCGLCGDFNNEKVAEMRSPGNVPLSSGPLFVASYAFDPLDGSGKCKINQKVKKQLVKEVFELSRPHILPSPWIANREFISYFQGRLNGRQNNSQVSGEQNVSGQQSHSHESLSQGPFSFIKYQQLVINHPYTQSKICFSLIKLPVCPTGYQPAKLIHRGARFYCTMRGEVAQQIRSRIQSGQFANLPREQEELVEVSYPVNCVIA